MKWFSILLFIAVLPISVNAGEKLAFALRDIETGKLVASQNEKDLMILASVSKLFTAYYVLKNLDENFQYETKVYVDGKDLYLRGSGDPYLTAQDLVSLIYQLKRKGMTKVTGSFFVDDSSLSFTQRISDLGLRDQPDNPSIGALNVEFNRLSLYRGNKEFFPPLENIQLKMKAGTHLGQRFRLVDENKEIWEGFKKELRKSREELPTLDSTMFTGYYFRYLAKVHGIELPRPKRSVIAKGSKEMAAHKGLPLWRLVSLGLEYSNNLIAETLLKTAELRSKTKLMPWLNQSIKSKHSKEYSLVNGSGLTLENKSSALFMTDFLRQIYLKNDLKKPYMSYLSINGNSGGLQKLIRHSKQALRVYGKTGSLHYVNNLAGYLFSKNGKAYAYAIFVTDDRREKLNNKLNTKQEKLRDGTKSWYRSSNQKITRLLMKWLSQ